MTTKGILVTQRAAPKQPMSFPCHNQLKAEDAKTNQEQMALTQIKSRGRYTYQEQRAPKQIKSEGRQHKSRSGGVKQKSRAEGAKTSEANTHQQ